MKDQARRGLDELHVEGGSKHNGSLILAGLVDEFVLNRNVESNRTAS